MNEQIKPELDGDLDSPLAVIDFINNKDARSIIQEKRAEALVNTEGKELLNYFLQYYPNAVSFILTLLVLSGVLLFSDDQLVVAQEHTEGYNSWVENKFTIFRPLVETTTNNGRTVIRLGHGLDGNAGADLSKFDGIHMGMTREELSLIVENGVDDFEWAYYQKLSKLTDIENLGYEYHNIIGIYRSCKSLSESAVLGYRGFEGEFEIGGDEISMMSIETLLCMLPNGEKRNYIYMPSSDEAVEAALAASNKFGFVDTLDEGNPDTYAPFKNLLTGERIEGLELATLSEYVGQKSFENIIKGVMANYGIEDNACKVIKGTDGNTYEINIGDYVKLKICRRTDTQSAKLDKDPISAIVEYILLKGVYVTEATQRFSQGEKDPYMEVMEKVKSQIQGIQCNVQDNKITLSLKGKDQDGNEVCVPIYGMDFETYIAPYVDSEQKKVDEELKKAIAIGAFLTMLTIASAGLFINRKKIGARLNKIGKAIADTRFVQGNKEAMQRGIKYMQRPVNPESWDTVNNNNPPKGNKPKTPEQQAKEIYAEIVEESKQLTIKYERIYEELKNADIYTLSSKLRVTNSYRNSIQSNIQKAKSLKENKLINTDKLLTQLENWNNTFSEILEKGKQHISTVVENHKKNVLPSQQSGFNSLLDTLIESVSEIYSPEFIDQIKNLKFQIEQKVKEEAEIEILPKANLFIQNGELNLISINQGDFRNNFKSIIENINQEDSVFVKKASNHIINILNILIEDEFVDFEKLSRIMKEIKIVSFHETINEQGNEIALTVKLNNGKYVLITADRNEWPERTIAIEIIDESRFTVLRELSINKSKRQESEIKGLGLKANIKFESEEQIMAPADYANDLHSKFNQGFSKEDLAEIKIILRGIKDKSPIYWIELISELAKLINFKDKETELGLSKIIVSDKALDSYIKKSNPEIIAEKLLYRLAGIRIPNESASDAFTASAESILNNLIREYNNWINETESNLPKLDSWTEGLKYWLIRNETRIQIADVQSSDGRTFIIPVVTWHGH